MVKEIFESEIRLAADKRRQSNTSKSSTQDQNKPRKGIFTAVPCILILSKFYYQLMHKRTALKRSIKIYVKTAPTCFGLIAIIRERTT